MPSLTSEAAITLQKPSILLFLVNVFRLCLAAMVSATTSVYLPVMTEQIIISPLPVCGVCVYGVCGVCVVCVWGGG